MRNKTIIAMGLACAMAAPAPLLATSVFLAADALHSPVAAQGNSSARGSTRGPGGRSGGILRIERGTTSSISRGENANARAGFGHERAALGRSVSSVASDRSTTGTEKAAAIHDVLKEVTCGRC